MALPYVGLGLWGIRWIIPGQEGVNSPPGQFCHRDALFLCSLVQPFNLLLGQVDVDSFHRFSLVSIMIMMYNCSRCLKGRQGMLIYEYKLDGSPTQYAAIDEAIRITQFIRNKCVRLWMDERGISKNDLQVYCAVLVKAYPFANRLNSQARQASADRAWFAISRFYEHCKQKKPGKKGYPKFQHDNRSVEYKQTGWKVEADGKHLT